MKSSLILFLILITCHCLLAQEQEAVSVKVKKSDSRGAINKGTDDKGFIYLLSHTFKLTYLANEKWIKIINSKTGEIHHEENLDEKLSNLGYDFVDIFISENRKYIIASKKVDKAAHYYAFEVDDKLSVINNSPFLVGKLPKCRKYIDEEFFPGLGDVMYVPFKNTVKTHYNQKDKSTTFASIVSCDDAENKTILIIKINDKNEEVFNKEVKVSVKDDVSHFKIYSTADKTYLSFNSEKEERDKGLKWKTLNKAYIFELDNDGVIKQLTPNFKEDVFAVDYNFVEANGEIRIVGQLIDASTENHFSGFYSSKVNSENNSLEDIKTYMFDQSFINDYFGSTNEESFLTPFNVYLGQKKTADNSSILFLQQRSIARTSDYSADGSSSINNEYRYSHILMFKISNTGDILWVKKMPLGSEPINKLDNKAIIGVSGDDLFVLHVASNKFIDILNGIDNTSTNFKETLFNKTAITSIDKNGNISCKEVVDKKGKNIYYSSMDGANISSLNEFAIIECESTSFGESKSLILHKVKYD